MIQLKAHCCSILRSNFSTYHLLRMQDNLIKSRQIARELVKKRLTENLSKKGFRPSLLVNSGSRSYLFNCCEGTQRLFYSSKVKLRNVERLFITRSDWNNISGALGLSLTLQDAGSPNFIIHGTEDTRDIFQATKSFIYFYSGINCSTKSHLDGDYTDSNIKIKTVVIDTNLNAYENATDCDEQVNGLKRMKTNPKLLAYVCELPDRPGKLDPQKCRELKVPIGPLLGLLKKGNDITLPDGTLVRCEDVRGPPDLGINFLIVDCANLNEIDLIVNNATLNEYRLSRKSHNNNEIYMVVHFSPEEVTANPKYREWMDGFSETCRHLLLFTQTASLANFIDVYRLQYLMSQLDDVIFPPLYIPDNMSKLIESQTAKSSSNDSQYELAYADETEIRSAVIGDLKHLDRIINVSNLDKFHIMPTQTLEQVTNEMVIDATYRVAKNYPGYDEAIHELKDLQKTLSPPKDHEPEVVFLGTGSALPSKLRNTSGILVNFQKPHDASIILDCGEDTYGQLFRFYGPEKARAILKQLKMIYVSHHHADHHAGLVKILRHRKEVCYEPVVLLLPPGVENLLDYHNKNFDDISDSYHIYRTTDFKYRPILMKFVDPRSYSLKADLCKRLGGLLDDINLVAVDHCSNAFAVTMMFRIGVDGRESFKLAYSGDARPSEDFILSGAGCDLLIHEATFDHKYQQDAIDKKHCTSTEAIQVAKRMGAKFTILTHFSQRLSKIPLFTDHFDDTIGFAFDNLAIRCPSHFQRIPMMKRVLEIVFWKAIAEAKARHEKDDIKKLKIKNMFERYRSHS